MSDLPYTVVCTDDDEALWKAHRWEGITASTLPRLLGLVKYEKRDRAALIEEYAQRIDTFEGNASTEAGKRLEGPILDWAADLGLVHRETLTRHHELLRSREYPWLLATPDAEDRDGRIEVKTHSVYTAKDWKGGVPDHYKAQVLVQYAVTGCPRIRVLRWCYGEVPQMYEVPRVESEVRAMVAAAQRVWNEVQAQRKELNL